MKLAAMIATLTASLTVFAASAAHAGEPDPGESPSRRANASATVHIALSDGAQYDVTVARDGAPTSLAVHDGAEYLELHLRLVDGGRLRYDVKRTGAHAFSLDGEAVPPRGRPTVIGHIPYAGGACDVRLRMTDD